MPVVVPVAVAIVVLELVAVPVSMIFFCEALGLIVPVHLTLTNL
jgi:hypothetical protein